MVGFILYSVFNRNSDDSINYKLDIFHSPLHELEDLKQGRVEYVKYELASTTFEILWLTLGLISRIKHMNKTQNLLNVTRKLQYI